MKKRFLTLLLAALLLTGCAGAAMPTGLAPEESRRLMIYTSHKEEVYRPIIREFEERTGIWVEIVTGGTSQLLERIEQEQAAPRADIMFGGGVETLSAHRELFRQRFLISRTSSYSAMAYTSCHQLCVPALLSNLAKLKFEGMFS